MLVPFALLASIAPFQSSTHPPDGTGGLHWIDLDADGDVDALGVAADGSLVLLRQESDRRFVDASRECALGELRGVRSLVAADLDGDRRPDLVLGGADGLRLLRQTKAGTFVDASAGSGLEQTGDVLALERLDLEGDGGVDLHVVGAHGHRLFRDAGDGVFVEIDLGLAGVLPSSLATTRSVDASEVDDLASATKVDAKRERDAARHTPIGAGAPASASNPSVAGASSSTPAAGSPAPSPAATFGLAGCIKSISDEAMPSSCIEASSIPTLGLLHPLSVDFNIDDATGHVGMGTTAPTAGLHSVSEDGLLSVGNLFDGGLAAQGPGTRMLWYPRQAVFRAGTVTGTQWNLNQLGNGSAAFGENTIASGVLSFAAGGDTTASGTYSAAVGRDTIASGSYSVAGGQSTQAGYADTAFGRYNVGSGSNSVWVDTDPLFELGTGTSTNTRANALTVLKNGNVGITTATPSFPLHVRSAATTAAVRAEATATSGSQFGVYASSTAPDGYGVSGTVSSGSGTPIGVHGFAPSTGYAGYFDGRSYATTLGVGVASPAVPLHVDGGADAAPTGGGDFVIGAVSGQNLAFDGNELMARNNGAIAGLSLNADGGNVYISQNGVGRVGILTGTPDFDLHVNGTAGKPGGGSWSVASDARLKRDVEDLDGALERLLELRGVSYEYRDPASIGELPGRHVGFIAQEVERVFPEWVGEKEDGMKYVTVTGFEALAVEALRELHAEKEAEITALVEVTRAQQATIDAQLERIAALERRVAGLASLAARLDALERADARRADAMQAGEARPR